MNRNDPKRYPTPREVIFLASSARLPPALRLPLRMVSGALGPSPTLSACCAAAGALARCLGLRTSVLPDPGGRSRYVRGTDTVFLADPDLLVAVHELMHALLGPSEMDAVAASVMAVEAEWPGWLESVPSWRGHDPSTRPWKAP